MCSTTSLNLNIIIQNALSYDDVFDRIIQQFEMNDTTNKGLLWEELCKRYLLADGFDQVWSLKDLPSDVRSHLNLGTKDMGVDLIAKKDNKYSAVQCKYRKRHLKAKKVIEIPDKIQSINSIHSIGIPKKVILTLNRVSWKELSTFYALCTRTGPWDKMIVMTTADCVGRQGKKSKQDKTYAFKGFESTSRTTWLKMVGSTGNKLDETNTKKLTQNELREKRLMALMGKL